MLSRSDTVFLWEALELAEKGCGHTRPNPPVGAVIVKDGSVVGRGWHKKCGGDHAEVAAIKDAAGKVESKSEKVKSAKAPLSCCRTLAVSPSPSASQSCCRTLAVPPSPSASQSCCRTLAVSPSPSTLYVTLEPCSKPGRVGACTDAIVAAGIKRVVYAVADPNPKNRGKAKRVLAKHGIECIGVSRRMCDPKEWDACGGLKYLLESAQRLVAPFAKHVTTGVPYVTVKLAMSLDGKICDNRGDAKWISSARSRKVTGWERARVDAIMVGAETVRRDNPSLLSHNQRNDDLVRVVISKSGVLPKNARVFTDGAPNETLVYRDAKEALVDLGKRGIMHVLCEGGLKLATSLADAGLVDRWIAVTCPVVIGSRRVKDALRLNLYEAGFSDPLVGDRIGEYECSRG